MNEKPRILCVDDEPSNIRLYEAILSSQGYATVTAVSGSEALEKMREQGVDVVLLDVLMPGMSGFETCRQIRETPDLAHVPVVMVTTLADKESRLKGLEAGASDFLSKPFDRTELLVRVRNLLQIKEYEDFLQEHNAILEAQVAEKTSELRQAYIDTVYRLTLAAEFKDEDTYAHLRRISLFARHLAQTLGLPEQEAELMFYASPMHDVGKIGIPDRILLKPGRLDADEFETMKSHTLIGGKILKDAKSAILQAAETIALTHHERWDGSGYPFGLTGEQIPMAGRIVNLVDQYDALRSKRPYKPAFDHRTVFTILTEGDGRTYPEQFDPQVLAAFQDTHRHFQDLYEANP
jgi:putative two-component system response regulator